MKGNKRYIFLVKTTSHPEGVKFYEYGNNKQEAYENIRREHYEDEITYVGRKDFTDDIIEKAEAIIADM